MHKTQKLLNLLLSKPVVTLPEIMELKIASHTKAISNLRQAGYIIDNKKYGPRVGKSEYVLNGWCIDDVYMSNDELRTIRKNNGSERYLEEEYEYKLSPEMEKNKNKYFKYFEGEARDLKINGRLVDITKRSYTTAIPVKNNKEEIVVNDAGRCLSASIAQSQRDEDIKKQMSDKIILNGVKEYISNTIKQSKQTSQGLFNQIIKRFKSL